MKHLIFVLTFVAMLTNAAHAGLVTTVTGVAGSGVTQWTFSGSSTTGSNGTIRVNGNATFSGGDTEEYSTPQGQSGNTFINDTSIQDSLFSVLSGSATVTVGSATSGITQLFLDDDLNIADDFGVRVDNPIAYVAGAAISWTGSITIGVDISTLNTGTYFGYGNPGMFNSSDPQTLVISAPSTMDVPEPGTLLLVGLALACMARRRNRAV